VSVSTRKRRLGPVCCAMAASDFAAGRFFHAGNNNSRRVVPSRVSILAPAGIVNQRRAAAGWSRFGLGAYQGHPFLICLCQVPFEGLRVLEVQAQHDRPAAG
jgi:hypothetical protein